MFLGQGLGPLIHVSFHTVRKTNYMILPSQQNVFNETGLTSDHNLEISSEWRQCKLYLPPSARLQMRESPSLLCLVSKMQADDKWRRVQ